MVSTPDFRAPSHTNPVTVQSCLTSKSKPKNIQESRCAGRHAEWPLGNMFCRFYTIVRISFTIMLIISNVWAGFCWKKSWHPGCNSMYSGFMSNTKLRDRQASSYRCQSSTVSAVLKLLFTLFDYYADYFSYYTYYFKNTNGVWLSIPCGNPPPWFPEAAQKQQLIILLEQKQQIIILLEQKQQIILHRPRPSFPVQWMGQWPPPPAGPRTCPWGI